ncbi:MAG: hypothetical protein HN413_11320 [Chloroflexi bacterium]|jgi:diacylglycerol kinase (ATP)|nr:hypothetical protein [Chloroflexota bacterium]
MPQAYIVYNPSAGRFPSMMLTERAASVLSAGGWQTCLEQTNGGPHITELARRAVDEKMDAFFIAGGDGSINFAVKGLLGSETALGVLPAGTANVWAKEFGLPDLTWTRWMALEESARRYITATVRKVDVGFCNQRPFLLWGGIGLDALIIHHLEPRNRWAKSFAVPQYLSGLLQQAAVFEGVDLQIQVNGQEISGHYILAVASNIHLYAGGIAEISPAARLDDGQMDLWLFTGATWLEAVTHAWNLYSGQHVRSEQARCIPFCEASISSNTLLYVQLDGEPIEGINQVILSVQPRALKVLVPEKAPRTLFLD